MFPYYIISTEEDFFFSLSLFSLFFFSPKTNFEKRQPPWLKDTREQGHTARGVVTVEQGFIRGQMPLNPRLSTNPCSGKPKTINSGPAVAARGFLRNVTQAEAESDPPPLLHFRSQTSTPPLSCEFR